MGWASEDLVIVTDRAKVYATPTQPSEIIGTLSKGKHVLVLEKKGDFRKLHSRSRRELWVNQNDLGPFTHPTDYDLNTDVDPEFSPVEPEFKRIRLDLGASGGSSRGESIIEGAFGIEYFMMERLSLRNALFYRHTLTHSDFAGMDISVRGNGRLPLGALKLRGIIGAGHRFATAPGQSIPLIEIGGFAALRGFDIGMMAKYLPLSLSNSSVENELIYSIVFSGAANFF